MKPVIISSEKHMRCFKPGESWQDSLFDFGLEASSLWTVTLQRWHIVEPWFGFDWYKMECELLDRKAEATMLSGQCDPAGSTWHCVNTLMSNTTLKTQQALDGKSSAVQQFISLEPNYPTLEEQILRSNKAAASVILVERPVTWSTS